MEKFEDKIVNCVGFNGARCVREEGTFLLTAGEQKFYTKNEMQMPRRCPDCRKLKREYKELHGDIPPKRPVSSPVGNQGDWDGGHRNKRRGHRDREILEPAEVGVGYEEEKNF